MDYVLDFQGLHDNKYNRFKERCIEIFKISKRFGVGNQYFFFPPFDFKHLSDKKRIFVFTQNG